ncbi:hypothetical protein BL250_17675 [Erwinia sp. OLTSP20]|nr:hypothetical protein BV501_17750 [Erwinia sp. OAMSP11]PIJ71618.1 hypothetical protein BK416_11430 [Erwinia sp. OLSSP12]PIJ82688.1 hypothetical protein BLD47_06195 [Erwinia sp. OLCASP19]PIJ83155.1 hypothetical protein BLD46_10290 [Erwinia sp. OLMTSP26]PIJ85321.1 hypothetical protein BLD49_10850 [Erwinia sp. OLMDSP33]PIJ87892.1 hypothetical protein BL250_17675 [Erwinia sp. OLTSP20]PIJ89943.1 hypothetical protein BL249_14455 [Erwinia sp. OLFS4]
MTVIMENHCKQHVCLAEGKSIKTGHILTLKNGMTLQAGMFRLSITINDQDEDVCPTNFPGTDAELPELDDIILHGGQYIPWVESESHQDDILKRLAYEYKHFLLWGSSNQDLYDVDGKDENFLPERDVFLDGITERVKDKTIPECIFNDENLINIILDDLMSVAQEENMDDSPPDLLTALAPENMERIDTHPLPELLYRELYKLGLESPL